MHPSPYFKMTSEDAIAFAATSGVGHLTTVVDSRVESVVVPFIVESNNGNSTILGHVAVGNRQRASIDTQSDALLIVHGPVGYVSPSLYPTKTETGKVVPTLNYVSVHIRGVLRPIIEPDEFRALLARLTNRFESAYGSSWTIDDAPDDFIRSQMRAIAGFALCVTDVQGVSKASQNRVDVDRSAVRESFSVGTEEQQAIAHRMM